MLSPIGKELRRLRLERDERLMNMADKLGVTSSFLSALEMGRKAPPKDFVSKVASAYPLPSATVQRLVEAANASQKVFKIEAHSALARDTAGLLAAKFSDLTEDDLSAIRRILHKG